MESPGGRRGWSPPQLLWGVKARAASVSMKSWLWVVERTIGEAIKCVRICQTVWRFQLWPVALVQFCLWINGMTGLWSLGHCLPRSPPCLGTGSFSVLAALDHARAGIAVILCPSRPRSGSGLTPGFSPPGQVLMEAGRVLGKFRGLNVPKQKEAPRVMIELMGSEHGLDSNPPVPSHELTDDTLFNSSESQHSHL